MIIADDLTAKITSGAYAEGSLLDSERQLAEAYGVSTIVINRAMSNLAEKGLITKIPRKGNVVNKLAAGDAASAGGSAEGGIGSFQELHSFCKKKPIVVGVLAELPRFQKLWEKTLADFTRGKPGAGIPARPCQNPI